MMYDGESKSIENIKKGDKVKGDDSSARTVLDILEG